MLRQFWTWLGPARQRLLIAALVVTGMASLLLRAFVDADWSITAQTLLALGFLAVMTATIGSRMPPPARGRLFFTIGPALGLVTVGLFLSNDLFPVILGLAFGWLLAAQFFMRDTMQMEYRKAIKHMRKQEYKQAIRVITELIKREPDNPEHVHFRAKLNQLSGQTAKAIRDFEKVVELAPDQPTGYNGLAELYLQRGEYEQARQYGLEAYQREKDFWVAPYNLGMIEDRLGKSDAALEHLAAVLEKGLPESRHRLLTHLWMARAYYRQGDLERADEALKKVKRERNGLREWKIILKDEQAQTLRRIMEDDIRLAEHVIDSDMRAAEAFEGKRA
ncbi:MAG: tetratricopeptide repeat protein [Chloroflexi bacterium]|nr:tetratricopeptide repeat protein [Chloroflexota bacterium]